MENRPNKPPGVSQFFWNLGGAFLPEKVHKVLDKPWFKIKGAEIGGWSAFHFLMGVLTALFINSYICAFVIHTVWEAYQVAIGMTKLQYSSARWDTLFDTIFYMVGFFVGKQLF